MTTPAVALCNEALRMLGDATITSFDDDTDLAVTCQQLYATTVRGLLASYPWRFTLAKVQLARLADAPVNEWRYAHALPPDRLGIRQMFAAGTVGAGPLLEYELFDSRAFSNQPDLWCDYQREIDPANWPAAFRAMARHALASDMAVSVTASASMAQYHRQVAFGTPSEGGNGGLLAAARRVDGQQQPPQAIGDFPLIAARFGRW
jgi:hypothetical protein